MYSASSEQFKNHEVVYYFWLNSDTRHFFVFCQDNLLSDMSLNQTSSILPKLESVSGFSFNYFWLVVNPLLPAKLGLFFLLTLD